MTYTNRPRVVVSLYDFTGEALRPWAERGYTCHAFDIQHPREGTFSDGIHYRHADLHSRETLEDIKNEFKNGVAFAMAFPVCTDLAVSGARHFKRKAELNPHFQDEAAGHAMACAQLFDELNVPFFIENPVSVLASVWRKPNHRFHPHEYGGYISEAHAEHPRWSNYIAARDAYTKKTCLWSGGGFRMPKRVAVEPVDCAAQYQQHCKLGGKSQRTKDIRSATPRGFARAVCEANIL